MVDGGADLVIDFLSNSHEYDKQGPTENPGGWLLKTASSLSIDVVF